jgi:hypothetical protein
MTEGFPVDSIEHRARVAHWAEGIPTYWLLGIVRMRGRRRLPITTWRCVKCGYLESYATERGTR